MQSKLSSWWSWLRRYLVTLSVIAFCASLLVFVGLAYALNWTSTGIPSKTAWDWFTLLIVPLILAIGGFLFSRAEQAIADQRYQQEQKIALDKQREDALQAYFDRMSELLLDKHLRASSADEEVRTIARTRTITIIRQLDTERQNHVFSFLREARLVSPKQGESIIPLSQANFSKAILTHVNLTLVDLSGADFSGADLVNANLSEANMNKVEIFGANLWGAILLKTNLCSANLLAANLRAADLSEANLSGASLTDVDLSKAHLVRTNLSGAELSYVNLSEANLSGANLSGADLKGANLSGANLSGAKLSQSDLSRLSLTEDQKKSLVLL